MAEGAVRLIGNFFRQLEDPLGRSMWERSQSHPGSLRTNPTGWLDLFVFHGLFAAHFALKQVCQMDSEGEKEKGALSFQLLRWARLTHGRKD